MRRLTDLWPLFTASPNIRAAASKARRRATRRRMNSNARRRKRAKMRLIDAGDALAMLMLAGQLVRSAGRKCMMSVASVGVLYTTRHDISGVARVK